MKVAEQNDNYTEFSDYIVNSDFKILISIYNYILEQHKRLYKYNEEIVGDFASTT